MKNLKRRDFILSFSAVLMLPRWAQGAAAENCRFGMVTDSHYADVVGGGSRKYSESLEKMRECIDSMNEQAPSFLVHGGDFIDGVGHPTVPEALERLEAINNEFARFEGPHYNVLGNHCLDALSKSDFLSGIENTGIDPERSFYSFDVKGLHFVVLDACFQGDGTPYDKGNFNWTDANIPADQLAWLEDDLENTRLPAIVFVHQLLDGSGNVYINNAADVREVLENSGKTLAVFHGHHHQGQYNNIKDIHYYTLRAMVEGSGETNNSYAILKVQSDRIVVEGYRRAVSREMQLPGPEGLSIHIE